MANRVVVALAVLVCAVLVPSVAFAQATLTGVVRDTSGAVLPGVTVEASSPALIEKVRKGVTDSGGQYRLTELPPGSYELLFTLNGFSAVRRSEVAVSGSGVIPINAEMRVGSLQETITVTGETPVVDTQTTRRETVLSQVTVGTLPATRGYGAILMAIPSLQTGGFSAQTSPEMTFFTAHGGRSNEGRVMVDGLNTAAAFNGGGVSTLAYDSANAQELQVLISGGLGESENGGPSINIIPRSGGNTFRGSAFYSSAGDWSRSDNIDDELRAFGLNRPAALLKSWDVSGTYGGPIKRDRLWFFGNVRSFGDATAISGLSANANAGNPTAWLYVPDPSVVPRSSESRAVYSLRLTSQITPRNRVSFSHEHQRRCEGSALLDGNGDGACRSRESGWVALGSRGTFTNNSPEADPGYFNTPYNVTQATWSSPITSRVLAEAGFSRFQYRWSGFGMVPPGGILNLIPVTEQVANTFTQVPVGNFDYRGITNYSDNNANPNNWRASVSYVTGAHSMKLGYQGAYQRSDTTDVPNEPLLSYRFNNGVPNRVSFRIGPWLTSDRTTSHSLFAQDQWTRGRMTLQGALRYDRASSFSPAEHQGAPVATRFNPQPIAFPRTVGVAGYHDISPRLGAAYDLFGTGKTALKFNIGRYLQSATNDENYTRNNPATTFGAGARFVNSTFRDWTDGNGNRVPDCDLTNPLRQDNLAQGGDLCAQWNNLNFGNPAPEVTTVNPDILKGWDVRPYDWQFGLSIHQEVLPRISLEASYNRRWFGNFFVTDNLTRNPEDFDKWTLTAPLHPELPGGGGYPATYYNINPTKFALPSRNYVTFETDYAPARTAYWHGVDVTVNARLRNGILFQGGTSTGRGVRDTCELTQKLPELLLVINTNNQLASCDVTEQWATAFRGLATYTVPKIDVLVSAIVRSTGSNTLPIFATAATNGTSLSAFYNVPNTVVQQSLGRLPSGGTATGNTTVDLLVPGEKYGDDRINLVDMRFAKVIRFADKRVDIGIDLYNLFNSNDTTLYDTQFGVDGANWLRPTQIVQPRFARFNVTLDF